MGTEFKVVNGTSYHIETNDKVIQVLEGCRKNSIRIVLDYGDTETGESWGEVYDIRGYVGRSCGTHKMPLLLYNSRSMCGGLISSRSIIGIKESRGGRVLYKFQN